MSKGDKAGKLVFWFSLLTGILIILMSIGSICLFAFPREEKVHPAAARMRVEEKPQEEYVPQYPWEPGFRDVYPIDKYRDFQNPPITAQQKEIADWILRAEKGEVD